MGEASQSSEEVGQVSASTHPFKGIVFSACQDPIFEKFPIGASLNFLNFQDFLPRFGSLSMGGPVVGAGFSAPSPTLNGLHPKGSMSEKIFFLVSSSPPNTDVAQINLSIAGVALVTFSCSVSVLGPLEESAALAAPVLPTGGSKNVPPQLRITVVPFTKNFSTPTKGLGSQSPPNGNLNRETPASLNKTSPISGVKDYTRGGISFWAG